MPEINNLITTDAEKIGFFFDVFNILWSSIFIISIVIFILFQLLGSAIFMGSLIMGVALVFKFIFSSVNFIYYGKMMEIKDQRISLQKDIIEGMKNIKFLGWENIFMQKVNKLRKKEYKNMILMRCSDGFIGMFWLVLSPLMCYGFIYTFMNQGQSLENTNVFVIMYLFSLLTVPLATFPSCIKFMSIIYVSYQRIQKYIMCENVQEQNITKDQNENYQIIIKNMQFQWPKYEQYGKNNKKQLKEKQRKKYQQINDLNENQDEDLDITNDNLNQQNIKLQQFNKNILKIQNLNIEKSKLTFVIGQVGAGKTQLLQSFLNELEPQFLQEDSQLIINGTIAYVSQNHWLQNLSIKDNILFGQKFDQKWYQKCLEVCQLEKDIIQFEQGDKQFIGPLGNNLSGGQKQRLSLCRAIYQNKDVYLLDDIFSSLDGNVANLIFQNCIQDLLIEKMKKTVILVTSQYQYIDKIDKSQQNIILVKKNEYITQDEQQVSDYLKNQEQQENIQFNEEKDQQIQQQQQLQKQHEKFLQFQEKLIDCNENDENQEDQDQDQEQIKEQNQEYRDSGNLSSLSILYYFKNMKMRYVYLIIITALLMEMGHVFLDYYLKDQVDQIYNKQQEENNENKCKDCNNESRQNVVFYLFQITKNYSNQIYGFDSEYTALLVNFFIFTIFCMLFYVLAALNASKNIFNKLNQVIMYSNMNFYDNNPCGRIISRISSDIGTIDDQFPLKLIILIENSASLICYSLTIIFQIPTMMPIFAISYLLVSKIQAGFRPSNRELKRLDSVNEGNYLTTLNESIQGIQIIRVFDNIDFIVKQFKLKMKTAFYSHAATQSIFLWLEVRLLMISNIIIGFLCIICSVTIIFNFSYSYTTVIFTIQYSTILCEFISSVIQHFSLVEQQLVSVERIRQFNQNNILENLLQQQQEKQKKQQIKSQNIQIEFKNVYLSYKEQNQTQNQNEEDQEIEVGKKYALNNINFKIQKGEKVAFLGRTGSGKTSILNTLYRLYEINDQSSIYLNNQNIKNLSLKDLRNQLAIIPQFGFLYKETVKENLDPDNKYSQEEIQNIINKLYQNENYGNNFNFKQNSILKANFMIEESGKNLSNGEKQIINYLRMVLKIKENQDSIVCLDEATSNMDKNTDQLIHSQLFNNLGEQQTLLVITHRLENIHLFDKIIVLEKGEIIEMGSFNELKNLENGFLNKILQKEVDINI